MKFSWKEMLCTYKEEQIPKDVKGNMKELMFRLNVLGQNFSAPRYLTCAYRDEAHNKRVGGAARSNHLTGRAADIADSDKKLKTWLSKNKKELERANLYAEDFASTPTWVHLQINPPQSGNRVFKP